MMVMFCENLLKEVVGLIVVVVEDYKVSIVIFL